MYKSGLFFSFSKMKNLIGFDKRSFLTTGFSALTTAKGIREIRWWYHSKETSRRFYPTTKEKTFCGTGHRLKTNNLHVGLEFLRTSRIKYTVHFSLLSVMHCNEM